MIEDRPNLLNQAWLDLPEETIKAAQLLDCRIVFDDGGCPVSCTDCGLKRHLMETYISDENKE